MLPHTRANDDDKQLEEERRLLFVGITRAQRELYLSRCRIRTFRGQQQATFPSRFLEELPSEPMEHHDRSGVELAAAGRGPRRRRMAAPARTVSAVPAHLARVSADDGGRTGGIDGWQAGSVRQARQLR